MMPRLEKKILKFEKIYQGSHNSPSSKHVKLRYIRDFEKHFPTKLGTLQKLLRKRRAHQEYSTSNPEKNPL